MVLICIFSYSLYPTLYYSICGCADFWKKYLCIIKRSPLFFCFLSNIQGIKHVWSMWTHFILAVPVPKLSGSSPVIICRGLSYVTAVPLILFGYGVPSTQLALLLLQHRHGSRYGPIPLKLTAQSGPAISTEWPVMSKVPYHWAMLWVPCWLDWLCPRLRCPCLIELL